MARPNTNSRGKVSSEKGRHQNTSTTRNSKLLSETDIASSNEIDEDAYLDMLSRQSFFASTWRMLRRVAVFALAAGTILLVYYLKQYRGRHQVSHGGQKFFQIRPFRVLGNISVEEFEANYAGSLVALPTLFQGISEDVFRPQDWTRRNLYKECGSTPLIQPHRGPQCQDAAFAGQDPSCHHVRIVHESLRGQTWGGTKVANLHTDFSALKTVRDVLELQDRSPLGYEVALFDAPLLHHCPGLRHRVRVPKYFPRDYYLLLDWVKGVDPRDTRNWPSIIVSKKGGGTFLHADSGMTRFWAQQLSGRKRWRVFPLRESHNLAPSPHLHYYYPVLFEMDAFHPDFDKYPDAIGVPVYEVVTEPGDVIFIPEGWAHQVENVEDSVITSMNFWDNHAVETATRELSYSLHLTSGAELLSAFFFPLDNRPVRYYVNNNENIEFDNYFAQRFLAQETVVPQSVMEWVEQGGKQAIDMERDAWGLPALHVAVYYDFFCVLQYLIEVGGADVNVQSADNVTALDFAEWNGRWEMWNVLRYSYGARGRLDGK